ncbi:MAG: hypothetical protein J0I40_10675, partial [Cellulomonas sp.]|nr:hypothetical protein [Cellulomonas sp.]
MPAGVVQQHPQQGRCPVVTLVGPECGAERVMVCVTGREAPGVVHRARPATRVGSLGVVAERLEHDGPVIGSQRAKLPGGGGLGLLSIGQHALGVLQRSSRGKLGRDIDQGPAIAAPRETCELASYLVEAVTGQPCRQHVVRLGDTSKVTER